MQCRGVAEEGEIGREIQRVEIDAAIGQPLRRQAHRIEAEDPRRFRQIRRKLPDQPLGVERGDKDRARPARRQARSPGGRDGRAARRRCGRYPARKPRRSAPGQSRRSRRTRPPRRADRRSRPGRTLPATRSARAPAAAACGCVSALYSVLPPRTLSKVSMRKAIPGHYTATRRRAAPAPFSRLEAARSGQPQHRFRDRAASERQLQAELDEAEPRRRA